MGFGLVVLLIAIGLEIWKNPSDKSKTDLIAQIQPKIASIDLALDLKTVNEIQNIRDAGTSNRLLNATNRMCVSLQELGKLVNMKTHCKELSLRHP